MSDRRAPQSPWEAREEIARLRLKLEAVTDLYETAVMELADAHARWEEADDRTWLDVRNEMGPTDEHGKTRLSQDYRSEVNQRTRKERNDADGADRLVKRIERTMRSLETQIGASQSEAKSLQAELDHAHYGESPQAPQWGASTRDPRPRRQSYPSAPHPAEVAP